MTMKLIQTQTIQTTGITAVTFSSVPQTFDDLLVFISSRSTGGSAGSTTAHALVMILNEVTTGAYTTRQLTGTGSSATSTTQAAVNAATIGFASKASDTANSFGNASVYISNYKSSVNKSLSVDSVSENNATEAYTFVSTTLCLVTSPVTTVRVNMPSADYVVGSTVSLYGITKGSDGIVTVS